VIGAARRSRASVRSSNRQTPKSSKVARRLWEHAGIICTGETYKAVVKLTFAKGASLKDPACLF